jgi:hypothetical protein
MIFNKIANMGNVEAICHYFRFRPIVESPPVMEDREDLLSTSMRPQMDGRLQGSAVDQATL